MSMRAPRPLGQRRHGARDGQHLRAARGIVLGAVVDLVAGLVRLADAEVIVVRGVDDHLVLELRIAARQQRRRRSRCARARSCSRSVIEVRRPSGTGLKSRLLRGCDQLVEVVPAGLHEAARGVFGGPALELDARLAFGRQLELLAAPGGLHDLPRIAGRRRGVDDDRRPPRPAARRSRTCRSSGRSTGASCRANNFGSQSGSLLSITSTLPLSRRP